jgi:hypothetical protein
MVNDKELAALIVRKIFSSLDFQELKCDRLEGKVTYNGEECDLAGWAEGPLANLVESVLKEHRSY